LEESFEEGKQSPSGGVQFRQLLIPNLRWSLIDKDIEKMLLLATVAVMSTWCHARGTKLNQTRSQIEKSLIVLRALQQDGVQSLKWPGHKETIADRLYEL